ncbi:MAG: hypothetical protein AB7F64_01705 [Gammaproteobacteria bacterium]
MLTRMFRRRSIISLGVSFNANGIFVVVVKKIRSNYSLVDCLYHKWPSNLIECEHILDKKSLSACLRDMIQPNQFYQCPVSMALPDRFVFQHQFSLLERYSLREQITHILLAASERFECAITALQYDAVYAKDRICYAVTQTEIVSNYVDCMRLSNLSLKILDVESNVKNNADKQVIQNFNLNEDWYLSCALALRALKND